MSRRSNTPRTILITGASSGIGAALARAYAGPGVFLALGGRDAGRLDRVAAECAAMGAEVAPRAVDVTDRAAMADWVTGIDGRHPLDLVIANAGIARGVSEGVGDFDLVRSILDVNLIGVLNTLEPALAGMRARRRGQVALMASLAALRGVPGAHGYCASKAAVKALAEGLRAPLRAEGVSLSVVLPGFVRTPMNEAGGFPTPLRLEADRAARLIRRELERGRPVIAFPRRLAWAARALGMAPALADALAMRVARAEGVAEGVAGRPAGRGRWGVFLRSLASLRDPAGLAALDLPWWTFAATEHVDAFLAARGGAATAFEYGPGASTVWLARRCARVSFVEHDARWWDTILGLTAGLSNVGGVLVEPAAAVPGADACRSGRLGHRGYDYACYVEAIRAAGGPFDVVVIDGRARAACLREAVAHLAPDGIVVFDNAGRRRYRRAIAGSGLAARRFRGLTPAAPYPTQTAVLSGAAEPR